MDAKIPLLLALVLIASGCAQQATNGQPAENISETSPSEDSQTPQSTGSEGLIQEGSTLTYTMTEDGETNEFSLKVSNIQDQIVTFDITEDFGYRDFSFNYTYDMKDQRVTEDTSVLGTGFLNQYVAPTVPFIFRPLVPSSEEQISQETQQKIEDLMKNGEDITLNQRQINSAGETTYQGQIPARELQIGDLSYLVTKQEPYIALRFPAEGKRDGNVLKLQTGN